MRTRLDTVTGMDPGSSEPIGTLKEIKKLGLSPLKHATCSRQGPRNRGCQHFDHPEFGPCPILALLNARHRPGPERVAFARVKSPTRWKQDATDCFNYMSYIAHDDPKNGIARIIGLGGDVTIRRRSSVVVDPDAKHPMSRFKLLPERIERFPRPNESMSESAEVTAMAREMMAAEGRDSMMRTMGHQLDPVSEEYAEGDEAEEVEIGDDEETGDVDGDMVDLDDSGDSPGDTATDDLTLDDEPAKPRRGRRKQRDDGDDD